MTVTREALAPLLRQRVCVATRDDRTCYRVLTAVTPAGELVLADQRGHTVRVALADVATIEDARHACDVCGDRVNNVFVDDADVKRCADCARAYARTLPPPSEPCEECGELGAFYSPAAKRFACAQCHARRGTLTGLGVERRVLEATVAGCAGADTEDGRHRWFHIKGHRWHCKLCGARRFTDPVLGTIWREPSAP